MTVNKWCILILLSLQYYSIYAAPAGMMAFFRLESCPEGWVENVEAQGRLIHSVTNSSHVNLTLGTPLSDLEPPTHSHSTSGSVSINTKNAMNCCATSSTTIASGGATSYSIPFIESTSNYPFVQLLLCRLLNDTTNGVPTGMIAFFDSSTCPINWTPYSESIGRFIIPGSSENGIVYSTSDPLESLEDRLHFHQFSTSFTTSNQKYNHFWDDATSLAAAGQYSLSGITSSSSSNFPYIQLLTCRSNEGGAGLDLPLGIHLFYGNGYCNTIPSNYFWEDADTNITGHWVVARPPNGTVGYSFGGNAWKVSPTSGRDGSSHLHTYNTTITLGTRNLNIQGSGESYVKASQYRVMGASTTQDLGLPYLSVPLCALVAVPTPSPSPIIKSKDSGNFKWNNMWIGIVAGAGGFLVLSVAALSVVVKRRSNRKQEDDDEKHYTMVLSAIHTDSTTSVNNIQIKERLGQGNFGEVFKGIWNGTTPVALKKLKSREQLEEFAQEAKVLLSLNHPNIVRCMGIHTSPSGEQYIVMEYLSKGSLDSVLKKEPNLKIGDLLIMAKHAAAGMLHLEQQQIVHRDLALRNLLVAHEASSYTIKVSDFGLSRKVEEGYYMKLDTQGVPVRWTAPEIFEKGLYTTKSDVWSFGITLWELMECKVPYPTMTNVQVMEGLNDGLRPTRPTAIEIPDALWTLMELTWRETPAERPTFNDICNQLELIEKDWLTSQR